MDKLNIIYISPKDINPYIKNVRVHDDKHVGQIVSSIKTFSFTNPILIDENNGILAGHGRWMAAKHLNMESIPCVRIATNIYFRTY